MQNDCKKNIKEECKKNIQEECKKNIQEDCKQDIRDYCKKDTQDRKNLRKLTNSSVKHYWVKLLTFLLNNYKYQLYSLKYYYLYFHSTTTSS